MFAPIETILFSEKRFALNKSAASDCPKFKPALGYDKVCTHGPNKYTTKIDYCTNDVVNDHESLYEISCIKKLLVS